MVRRSIALILVVGQVTLALSGCLSVRATGSHTTPGPGGGVSVAVFQDDSARNERRPGPAGILGELERQDGRTWRTVFRSLNPTWTVVGLPPGVYRVRFPAHLDDSGNVVRLGDNATGVTVKDGAVTEVQAVLDHVSTGLVILAAVTVVVVVYLLAKESHDHGIPAPPPPPPWIADIVFHVAVDLAFTAGAAGAQPASPPGVTSTFPGRGALVAARRPRVIFAMSEPLRPDDVKGDAVSVLGESSGLVAGQVSYDAEHWWVVWEPRADLPPGDTYHVTLAGDGVESFAGREMSQAVTFTFKTAK
ncbi:MAG TPA: Ig-like domain-containing protein [Thermoanaerobaculaceae bacterium]|nr:Ig-like domain-containing protein [Thermoanaerobaculaceae bacterium]